MKDILIKNRFLVVLFFGLLIFISLVNKIGKTIERNETEIYQKITGKKPQYILFDSLSVPYVVFEGKLGKQYSSVTVAEQSIKWADERDSSYSEKFFNCINWLITNHLILNDSSIIFFDYYDWPSYKMTSPWRSAMNQGRAMQAFLKAFAKTNDTIFLDYAKKSMNALNTEVRDGGVTYKDNTGYWYEEYADDSVPQSRVLNGMIVVLQALSDYHKVTNDPEAIFLFNKGLDAVKSSLHLYDTNGHSNYDVLGKPAKPWYHKFHIELMKFLYAKTHEPIFYEYIQKWSEYKEPSYLKTLFQKPTKISAFAVFTLFVISFCVSSIISFFLWRRR